jgi:pyridoxamine 5'-phosphate oxidase
VPSYFEFWQGRPNRMHERIEYQRSGNDWEMTRLQP